MRISQVLLSTIILSAGVIRVDADALRVVTTTTDLAALTKAVGGDLIEVQAIARGSQDPHFVDARPSFMRRMRGADLLVYNGLELEIGWLPLLVDGSRNRRLQAGDDPPRWHRLFWAITLTILPLALMFIGGYEVMQTVLLVVSLPILGIGVFMSVALVKQLGADRAGAPATGPQ